MSPVSGCVGWAGRVGIGQAVAARSAARLEEKELVTRTSDAGKPRSWVFGMTPEGIGVRLRLRTALIVAQDRLMAPLSDRERETLKDLIRRVIEADDNRAPQRR